MEEGKEQIMLSKGRNLNKTDRVFPKYLVSRIPTRVRESLRPSASLTTQIFV